MAKGFGIAALVIAMRYVFCLRFAFCWIALSALFLPNVASADTNEVNAFLEKNYGWTLNLKDERRLFGWSWDISCDSSRAALPESGKNIFRNWVCRQQDRNYWTVIYWRLPSIKPAAVQQLVYNTMAQNLGHGPVSCSTETSVVHGSPRGTIADCTVPLQHGTFYVSFYHFESTLTSPYTFDSRTGPSTSNTLAFTVWVQNAGNSDQNVKAKLRELISGIRFLQDR